MIGEYLGMIQNSFNMSVLEAFCGELDLSGNAVDVALRKFQSYFRMPGEAQKIEKLMQSFSQRYEKCNPEVVSKFKSPETVSVQNLLCLASVQLLIYFKFELCVCDVVLFF